jgi:hypothetical protein
MTLQIGKSTLTNDATEIKHIHNGLEHRVTIAVASNISDRRTEIREQCRHANRTSITPVPLGHDILSDTSPFYSNTIYVQTNDYSGWAIIYSFKETGTQATRYEFDIGFYEIEDLSEHYINIEAEDNNSAGTDTTDTACSNDEKVVYTPTGSSVKVLDTAALNLPSGSYSFYACVYANTTSTVELQGVTPGTTGSFVSPTETDTWHVLDLGAFTISATTDDFRVNVRDTTNTNDIEIDYLLIRKEDDVSRKYGVWDSASWG